MRRDVMARVKLAGSFVFRVPIRSRDNVALVHAEAVVFTNNVLDYVMTTVSAVHRGQVRFPRVRRSGNMQGLSMSLHARALFLM